MRYNRLWFGPIAVALFLVGTIAIGLFTPDYSHVRQTVSELGEAGAPGQVAFSVLLCLIATCLIVCASAIARARGICAISDALQPDESCEDENPGGVQFAVNWKTPQRQWTAS
jgi:hypothetical membrane protein